LEVYRELGTLCRVERDAAIHFVVHVGPPPPDKRPDEMRVYLPKFGAHCSLFIPGYAAMTAVSGTFAREARERMLDARWSELDLDAKESLFARRQGIRVEGTVS
jgi:hypothetical protein